MKYPLLENSVLGKPLKNENYTIIGAGITGLMLGYYLKKKGVPFKIIESTHRAGGILGSVKSELGLIEKSATSFRWSKEIQDMCEDLGLRIITASSKSKKKYFYSNGELKRFPLTTWEVLSTIWNLFVKKSDGLTTLKQFGETHFSEAAIAKMIEPAMFGIYSGMANELSFPATLPDLAQILNTRKRLGYGLANAILNKNDNEAPERFRGALGFKQGMQALVDALSAYLQNEIEYQKIVPAQDLEANPTILTIPAYNASNYFNGEMRNYLNAVHYSRMITATVYVKKTAVPYLKPGFGCLVPRGEGLNTLGLVFNNYLFPSRGVSNLLESITVIIRDFDGSIAIKKDTSVFDLIKHELEMILGFKGAFLDKKLFRWEKGIPIYSNDLYESWFKMDNILKAEYPTTRLFGNYTGQISIRGMCTHAKQAVDMI